MFARALAAGATSIAPIREGHGWRAVRVEPGDESDEGLYQDEFDAGRARDYEEQVAALERAEARLADGTYGLSVESGEPIPDERLEAYPLAERTVEEEERGRSR